MKNVILVEMGLRDGLQNEKINLSIETRLEIAQKLSEAGSRRIEIGAFVSPKWVPQMAGSLELTNKAYELKKNKKFHAKTSFSVLVPNEQGMQDALTTPVKEIALFAASSESFSQKNINCSIDESFNRFVPVMELARKNKIKVRGYLSTCFGCPFDGKVPEKKVLQLAKRMMDLGVYELSIGDTIGVAHAAQVESLIRKLKKVVPVKKIAGHFHDTRGQALTNIYVSYELGLRTFDTSVGGLGGCPYAPGAAGNVATEDVVYMFHGMGVKTGLNLEKLIEMNQWLEPQIGHRLSSKVGRAGILKPLGRVKI